MENKHKVCACGSMDMSKRGPRCKKCKAAWMRVYNKEIREGIRKPYKRKLICSRQGCTTVLEEGRKSAYCKPCAAIVAKEWREKHKEHLKVYRKALYGRADQQERIKAYRRNPVIKKREREKQRLWRSTERGQDYLREYRKSPKFQRWLAQYRDVNKNADRARKLLNWQVYEGKFPKAELYICVRCREQHAQNWHHFNGYEPEHWFDVIPLCDLCHGEVHSDPNREKELICQ